MKSRVSFFNTTVLRKDITRFAPVWGLYFVYLLLFTVLQTPGDDPDRAAQSLDYALSSLPFMNLTYAGICVSVLFGDLFKTRMCNALHAMPLRRESWFLVHISSGFLFHLVPSFVVALLLIPVLQQFWYMALVWLAVSVLEFAIFFGIGVFSAMCVGSRLGLAVAYGIINYMAALMELFAAQVYEPLLHGVELDLVLLRLICPMTYLSGTEYVDMEYVNENGYFVGTVFKGVVLEDWIYLAVAAAVGMLLLFAALRLYRRRALETAGDLLALPEVKPLFLVVYTLAVGVLLSGMIGTLIIGLLIGFFTGKMLIERTVRVFKWKSIRSFLLILGAFVLSVMLTLLDPLGITCYVPATADVEFVCVDSDIYASSEYRREVSDPEEIEQLRQIHSRLTEDRSYATYIKNLELEYTLKDGSVVKRSYYVDTDSELGQMVKRHYSHWEYVFQENDWDFLTRKTYRIIIELPEGSKVKEIVLYGQQEMRELLEAVKADCDAGTMAQKQIYQKEEDAVAWIYVYKPSFAPGYLDHDDAIKVYGDCRNITAYINARLEESTQT